MEIGGKLRQARSAARLTQKQVAEALGVSRQTVSNWETEKTYPDIVSVIRLSELYDISLDRLLKGKEEPMDGYLNYLQRSTDTVKSQARLSRAVLLAVYLAIWAFALLEFWVFLDPGEAMGYSLVFFYLVLPVTTFVISFFLGKGWDRAEREKWGLPVFFGGMYLLAEYATFALKNMMANHFAHLNAPDGWLFLLGAALSALGLWLGGRKGKAKGETGHRRD